MKRLFVSILFLLTIGCSSYDLKDQSFEPSMIHGCSNFEGRDWERCMLNSYKRFERLGSEKPITTKLDEKSIRISDTELMVPKKTCFGVDVFCYKHFDSEFKPTLAYRIENHPITKFVIFASGVLLTIAVL